MLLDTTPINVAIGVSQYYDVDANGIPDTKLSVTSTKDSKLCFRLDEVNENLYKKPQAPAASLTPPSEPQAKTLAQVVQEQINNAVPYLGLIIPAILITVLIIFLTQNYIKGRKKK